jgi:diguanylate cyclase (GGDEF)-like protein
VNLVAIVTLPRQVETAEPAGTMVGRVLDAVPEAIVVLADDGTVAFANRKLERLCGYRRGELTGVGADHLLLEPSTAPGAGMCVRKDGACFPATVHVSNIAIDGDTYAICTIRDESDRWKAEEELAQQAMRDPLTELPNRRLLLDRVDQAIRRNRRTRGAVALLYIDLDWFKEINDTYGHRTGDLVLKEVAARLQRAVRPSDTVARLGGDEFVVLCDPIADGTTAPAIARRVLVALTEPAELGGVRLDLSASVGVAVSWGARTSGTALLQAADACLYRAKRAGRGRLELRNLHRG